MGKRQMKPDEVAQSAENQLLDFKTAQQTKIDTLLSKRDTILNQREAINTLTYEIGNTFKTVFPGAKGFIKSRIKTPNSIRTKARNEFTEILDAREHQVKDKQDQKEILDSIKKIDFKDILAFSVVTTVPPSRFRTGSDELNDMLTKLAEELAITNRRLKEHEQRINSYKEGLVNLSKEIKELRINLSEAMSQEEKEKKLEDLQMQIIHASKSDKDEEAKKLIVESNNTSAEPDKETITKIIEDKIKEFNEAKGDLEYGETTLSRTREQYDKTLRELQYQMSSYFVSNLFKLGTLSYWGTKAIRETKVIVKPGFRTVNTGYNVVFSKENNKFSLDFEVQGKGELDYNDAEFSIGALYHEEQKTKDGLISKKTEMPDFTIIGADSTKRIEKEIRLKYQDMTSSEDLLNNLSGVTTQKDYDLLREYEAKIKEQVYAEYGDNLLSKQRANTKLRENFNSFKENLIQDEVEKEIDRQVGIFADSDIVTQKIQTIKELETVYKREKQRLEDNNKEGLTPEEIEHRARLRVVYYAKEREISEYAKNSIPIFSRADISDSLDDEVMVYTFTTGESIYRYYINKLNGLKYENGKYKFEPQEQQKRALLKLTGLFEENDSKFYTYYKDTESFGGLEDTDNTDNDVERS